MKRCVLTIIIGCLLSSAVKSQAIKELSIGDTVPDISIKNIINWAKPSVKLSDFKDKIVIIDFWGTYCAPCISALFKMDSLQKKYKDQLQFITVTQFDTREKVEAALRRFSKDRTMQLPVVTGDQQLSAYFPYQLVSHVVWIGKDGTVKAITGSEYINEANVQYLLNGNQPVDWPVKKDISGYDYKKPFLDFTQKDIVAPSFLYSSALTGYLEGVSPPNGRVVDSAKGTATISLYNHSLFNFCETAVSHYNENDFVFEVKDIGRYIRDKKGTYYILWARENTYCYSLTLPLTIPEKEAWQMVSDDLLRWLGVMDISIRKEDDKYVITEKGLEK